MPPRQKGKPRTPQPPPTDDDRFKHIESNPRFKQINFRKQRAKVDSRFQEMLAEPDFEQIAVDKHNRKLNITETALKPLYQGSDESENEIEHIVGDSDDDDDDNSLADLDEDDTDEENKDGIDDDDEEESSTDIDISDDYDGIEGDDDDDEVIPEGHIAGSIKGDHAPIVEDVTRRIAMYNMEWEQLKAVDLLAIMRSFCPPGGKIHSVSVYPSEFGKQMMEREKRGDYTLWTNDTFDQAAERVASKYGNLDDMDEDDEVDSDEEIDKMVFGTNDDDRSLIQKQQEQLKRYELGKLRYYYAILDCDSPETAKHIYLEADGMEYESSSNVFDLRFVPDEHVFDESTLRDRATAVPSNHRPPLFQTNCLQSSKIECTWEREDPTRARLLKQAFDEDEYQVDDLAAFLDGGSDDENFHTDVPVSETDSADGVDSDDSDDSDVDDGEMDSDDDDGDEDDEDGEDDDSDETSTRAIRNKRKGLGDAIDADIIIGTKVVKGKRKKIFNLKRRARNEFSSILTQLKGGETPEEREKRKNKARTLAKATKRLQQGDDVDSDEEESSSSSDSDFGVQETPRQKQKKTIVFQSALDTFATNVVEKQASKAEDVRLGRLTVWQRQLEKMKEKKKEAKQRAKEKKREQLIDATNRRPKVVEKDSLYDDDDVTVDYNDDFFKDVFDEAEFGKVELGGSKKTKSTDDNDDDETTPVDGTPALSKEEIKKQKQLERARLALLMDDNQSRNDGDSSDDGNKGYNLQELVKKNKLKQLATQSKRKRAKEYEEELINSSLGLATDVTITEKDIKRVAKEHKIPLHNKKLRRKGARDDDDDDDALGGESNPLVKLTTSSPDDFTINTKDERFAAVFADPEFGIDPTSALYHETEGVTELLKESQRIRREKARKHEEAIRKRKQK